MRQRGLGLIVPRRIQPYHLESLSNWLWGNDAARHYAGRGAALLILPRLMPRCHGLVHVFLNSAALHFLTR